MPRLPSGFPLGPRPSESPIWAQEYNSLRVVVRFYLHSRVMGRRVPLDVRRRVRRLLAPGACPSRQEIQWAQNSLRCWAEMKGFPPEMLGPQPGGAHA